MVQYHELPANKVGATFESVEYTARQHVCVSARHRSTRYHYTEMSVLQHNDIVVCVVFAVNT